MIDLTPLDVRKKAGDFTKSLRGYDPQQVESFLELAAERLEELVKENLTLAERVERLSEQVAAQSGREKAVNDALVTAQQLRDDISASAEREADALRAEARVQADRMRAEAEERARKIVAEAENRLSDLRQAARELTRRRARFLANLRQMLERELDVVEVQEADTMEDYMVVGLGAEALSAGMHVGARPESDDAAPVPSEAEVEADEIKAMAGEVAEAVDPVPPTRSRRTSFEYAPEDTSRPAPDASGPDAPGTDAPGGPMSESADDR